MMAHFGRWSFGTDDNAVEWWLLPAIVVAKRRRKTGEPAWMFSVGWLRWALHVVMWTPPQGASKDGGA